MIDKSNIKRITHCVLVFAIIILFSIGGRECGGKSKNKVRSGSSYDTFLISAPSSLEAIVVSGSQINLIWLDNANNEDGFEVERKAWSDGIWSRIGVLGQNASSFTDNNVIVDVIYYYRVRAINSIGDASAYSNEATASTAGGWAMLATGWHHTLGLRENGTIWSWGDNSQYQLGFGDNFERNGPTQINTEADWVSVAASMFISFAIKTNRTLWSWGYNNWGQLGITDTNGNTITSVQIPTEVEFDFDWNQFRNISIVAPSFVHTLAIKTDNTLWGWGINNVGQLGLGDFTDYNAPYQSGTDSDWSSIAVGSSDWEYIAGYYPGHSLAIKTNGTLWGWGRNNNGQLGIGWPSNAVLLPTQVGTDSDWSMVISGRNQSLGIKNNRTLWAWGRNYSGAMGIGMEDVTIQAPIQVGTESDWETIVAGQDHTIALKTNRTLWAWGYNSGGSLGLGDNGIKRTTPTQVGTDLDWFNISAGYSYTMAIKNNRLAYAWGENLGQLGISSTDSILVPTPVILGLPNAPINLVANTVSSSELLLTWIDVANNETGFRIERNENLITPTWTQIAVVAPNTVSYLDQELILGVSYYYRMISYNDFGDSPYSDMAAGTTVFFTPSSLSATAISDSQITLGWFDNSPDEDGFAIERKLGAGGTYVEIYRTAPNAITYTDTVTPSFTAYYYKVRGYNSQGYSGYTGEVSATTVIMPVPSGLIATPISLTQVSLVWIDNSSDEDGFKIERKINQNGTWGEIGSVDVDVTFYDDITDTSFASNTVYYYRIKPYHIIAGSGSPSNEAYVLVAGDIASISAGMGFSMALRTNGTMWSWGRNSWGQLGVGVGDHIQRRTPTQIGADTDWSKISAGMQTALAIKNNGTMWIWGNGYSDIPSQVGAASNWVGISAGQGHLLARQNTGTLWSWGSNSYGQLGLGTTTTMNSPTQVGVATNWSNVKAGYLHSTGVKNDGSAWSWGYNYYGQLGLGDSGTGTNRNTPTQVGTNSDWSDICASFYTHTLGIKTDGTIWSWGENGGKLGRDSPWIASTPGQIVTDSDWSTQDGIATGAGQSFGRKTNGVIWGWGWNNVGQLGLGDLSNRATPVQVGILSDWIKISAGGVVESSTYYDHTLALNNRGVLYSWGSNKYGQLGIGNTINQSNPSVIIIVIPQAPAGLSASAISPLRIDLSWFDIAEESGYKIERSPNGTSGWVEIGTTDLDVVTYSDTTVGPLLTYYYRVRAYNGNGNSGYSNTVNATTPEGAPPVPTIITAVATSSSSLYIQWSDVVGESGYKIDRSLDGSSYAQVGTMYQDGIIYYDNTVGPLTTYYYKIRSFKGSYDSDYSLPISATTPGGAPSAPSFLNTSVISATQVNLSWGNVQGEDGYKIMRKFGVAGAYALITTTTVADVITYSDTTVTPSNTYYYKVNGYNSYGDGGYSEEKSATTTPSAPLTLTGSAISSSRIDLTWTDVSGEIGYLIERKIEITGTYAALVTIAIPDTTAYSDTGLSPYTTYYYKIRAYNSGGNGDYSSEANITTLAGPPAQPLTNTATAISGTQINLAWMNVTFEDSYKIERKQGAGGTYSQIATTGSDIVTYSDSGLNSGTEYYYKIRASNSNGDSDYSPVANATTPLMPPEPPGDLNASAVSSTRISLAWSDNSDNEALFKIERSVGGEGAYSQIATTGEGIATYNDDTVDPSTAYYYRVRSSNAAGDSSYCATSTATTLVGAPNIPLDFNASVVSSTRIDLSWNDVGGETGYELVRKFEITGTYLSLATVAADTVSYADTTVTPGNTYYYKVRAFNGSGNGEYSNEDFATASASLPEKPLSAETLPSNLNTDWGEESLGYQFSPTVNGTITALGRYIGTGYTGNTKVILWDDIGNKLGEVIVSSNDGWQWANLTTPIAVTAGTRYRVAVSGINQDWWAGFSFPATRGNITIYACYWISAADTFPDQQDLGAMYGWADIEFVPE